MIQELQLREIRVASRDQAQIVELRYYTTEDLGITPRTVKRGMELCSGMAAIASAKGDIETG